MNVRIRVGRRTVTVMPTRRIEGNSAAAQSTRFRAVRACSLVLATAAGCILALTAGVAGEGDPRAPRSARLTRALQFGENGASRAAPGCVYRSGLALSERCLAVGVDRVR